MNPTIEHTDKCKKQMKCVIGQLDRCKKQGYCSWEKVFEKNCSTIKVKIKSNGNIKVLEEVEKKAAKQKTVPIVVSKTPVKKPKKIKKLDRRRKIYDRSNGICYICGESVSFNEMTVDHVTPISRGGSNELTNLRATHLKCNQDKADKILTINQNHENNRNGLRSHQQLD